MTRDDEDLSFGNGDLTIVDGKSGIRIVDHDACVTWDDLAEIADTADDHRPPFHLYREIARREADDAA